VRRAKRPAKEWIVEGGCGRLREGGQGQFSRYIWAFPGESSKRDFYRSGGGVAYPPNRGRQFNTGSIGVKKKLPNGKGAES